MKDQKLIHPRIPSHITAFVIEFTHTFYWMSDIYKYIFYYISYDRHGNGGDNMGYGCCGVGGDRMRSFLTRDEKISLLKEYKGNLEKEIQGITEKIKDLETKK